VTTSPQPLHICSWKTNYWGSSALQLTGPPLATPRASVRFPTEKYPGLVWWWEGLETFWRRSCLPSDPVLHIRGYMGESKGQLLLSLYIQTWETPHPWFWQSSVDCTLCLCLQFGKGRNKSGSCPVSHLPAKWEAEGINAPKFLHWKSPALEGCCSTTTSSCSQWPGQGSVFAGDLFLTGRDQIIERILCDAGPGSKRKWEQKEEI